LSIFISFVNMLTFNLVYIKPRTFSILKSLPEGE
jgi:hypothetical protein